MTRLEFHHKEAIHEKVRHLNGKQVSSGFLLREGTIPSVVPGKRRVIDRLELERYVERRNAEGRKNLIAKGRVDVAA